MDEVGGNRNGRVHAWWEWEVPRLYILLHWDKQEGVGWWVL